MYGNDHVYGDAQACDDHVIFSRAAGTPAYPAAMRQDAANIQAGICAVDHVACVGNCRRNKLTSLLHRNSPRTRLLASNRMMLHQSRCTATFQPQGRKPSGSTQGLSVPPAQTFGASTRVCHRPYGRRAAVRKTTTAHMNYGKPTWADGLSRNCQPKHGSG